MSLSVIADNTTIKIRSAVANTLTISSGTSTLYTCASSSYAIVNISIVSAVGTTGNLKIGSQTFKEIGASESFNFVVYVGPSQSITVTHTAGGGSIVFTASGVDFDNSP